MNIVIYHKSDYDGIFCREIAKRALGNSATYIGWEYGESVPAIPSNIENLYILDLSVHELMDHPKLIWIDHHKSAIDKYGARNGIRMDGVAACRLTWQWFSEFPNFPILKCLPYKQDYIDRLVTEPYAVRLAGEYDIWDKRDPNAELFQHGLNSCDVDWGRIFIDDNYVQELLDKGKAVQYTQKKQNASIITNLGFELEWEGLKFLAINTARFNSLLFDARATEKHDALIGFCWDGLKWKVSLYHTPFNKEIDLSVIAVKYGGGGHKGACGFTCKTLPFKL